jgi:photosystem II stability/assembly factor-like uncharacterized protein
LDAQFVSADEGWAAANGRLYWTESGGTDWQEITTHELATEDLLSVFFLDAQRGWLVARSQETGQIGVLATGDRGKTWQPASLPGSNADFAEAVAEAYITFLDDRHGWIAFKQISGSNFSLGLLFSTQDGGMTWEERTLPLGEPVRFIDAARGWVAGGPAGDELYFTQDGGNTWEAQSLIPEQEDFGGQVYLDLPSFLDPQHGYLPVTVAEPGRPRVEIFTTTDGGMTWAPAAEILLEAEELPAGPALSGQFGREGVFIVGPGTGQPQLFEQAAGDQLLVLPQHVPEGAIRLGFTDSTTGWAQVQQGICTGDKFNAAETDFRCGISLQLLRSTDGGQSWIEITPPDGLEKP